MAIQVTCSGCHARFKVSEKFAGKKGPCPKCKAVITIPAASEEVVVHEPEHEAGARTQSGELVLKPLERVETAVPPMVLVGYGVGALFALLVAYILRASQSPPSFILYLGAIVLAPPLCLAGYYLMRDDELLESFTGTTLGLRTAICSVGYALLWAVFSYVYWRVFGDEPVDTWHVLFLAPPFLFVGAGIAFCCYDLDLGSGFFHYSLYLGTTIVLRLVMGLPAVGPAELPNTPELESSSAWIEEDSRPHRLAAFPRTFACGTAFGAKSAEAIRDRNAQRFSNQSDSNRLPLTRLGPHAADPWIRQLSS